MKKIKGIRKVAEIKIEDGKIIANGQKEIIEKMEKNLSSILIKEKWTKIN